MQTIKKTVFTLITVLVLTIALTSCKSTQKVQNVQPIQIETHFPAPYDENGNAIVQFDGETVTMPLWYWLKITEYVIDVETNKELQK